MIPCEEPWVDPRPLQLPPEKASQVQVVLPWRCEPQHPCWAGSTLTGHTGYVQSVAPLHDKKTLASGSNDNTIRLWQELGV